jgi:hypothetical protein
MLQAPKIIRIMKTNFSIPANHNTRSTSGLLEPFSFPALLWLLFAALVFLPPAMRAGVPEPDNILFGAITLDNQSVTAARGDVVIEARRLITGPAIASYRMGSSAQSGDFYSLRISLESAVPLSDANSSLNGDHLFIVVLDSSGIRTQAAYTVNERATIQRLDFGSASMDSDSDGLPDAWETQNFTSLNQSPDSLNLNGQTTLQNYVAGTNPNDTNSVFTVRVSLSNNLRTVSFQALQAESTVYQGFSRHYSLEVSTNLGLNHWFPVGGFSDILGNSQSVNYQTTDTNSPILYRAKVWLQDL